MATLTIELRDDELATLEESDGMLRLLTDELGALAINAVARHVRARGWLRLSPARRHALPVSPVRLHAAGMIPQCDAPVPYRKTTSRITDAAFLLMLLVCGLAAFPGIGFAAWVIGPPVLLVVVVLAVVLFRRGAIGSGLAILAGIIFCPIWIFFAPIVATEIMQRASRGARLETLGESLL